MNLLTKLNLYDHQKPGNANEGWDELRQMVEDVLEDQQQSKALLETKGDDAQMWLDALQMLAELPNIATELRSSILKMMLRLSKRSGLCPQCLIVKNVKRLGNFPVGGGGFGDVWKGKIGEQVVCLKVVKVYLVSDVQQLLQGYMQEAIVWQQLKHPNLLPFMGMYYLDKGRKQLCLVSPWMERGNLVRYLKVTPREQVDHYSLVYDIASGLLYLHKKKIVHGDLKGVNILITPDERACIGDFGLSRVADTHALRLDTSTITPSKGTTRWLSPELLRSEPPCTSSTLSDIYAFACVCYEIFTGNVPFYELAEGAALVAVLLDKKHPSRPKSTMLNDTMWNIMVDCWQNDPRARPSAEEVFERVTGIKNPKTDGKIKPAAGWDVHDFGQIWRNVKYPPLDTATLARLQRKLKASALVESTNFRSEESSKMIAEPEMDYVQHVWAMACMKLQAELNVSQKIVEGMDGNRRQAEADFTLKNLHSRVEDWMGHPSEYFGRLLLHDALLVMSGNLAKEYQVFLFERVLFFCKERRPAKADTISDPFRKDRSRIAVKGRISIAVVDRVEVISISPTQCILGIWWSSGNEHTSKLFALQFSRESQMWEWESMLHRLVCLEQDHSSQALYDPFYSTAPTRLSSQGTYQLVAGIC